MEWMAIDFVRLNGTMVFLPLFGGEIPNSPLFTAFLKADAVILQLLGEFKILLFRLLTIERAPKPLFPRSLGFPRMSW